MRWIFLETPSKCMKMQFLNCYMSQGIPSCDTSQRQEKEYIYIYTRKIHLIIIFGSCPYPALGERLASLSRSLDLEKLASHWKTWKRTSVHPDVGILCFVIPIETVAQTPVGWDSVGPLWQEVPGKLAEQLVHHVSLLLVGQRNKIFLLLLEVARALDSRKS